MLGKLEVCKRDQCFLCPIPAFPSLVIESQIFSFIVHAFLKLVLAMYVVKFWLIRCKHRYYVADIRICSLKQLLGVCSSITFSSILLPGVWLITGAPATLLVQEDKSQGRIMCWSKPGQSKKHGINT